MQKEVLILWDKDIFDGKKRLLPNVNKLYSQIYDLQNKKNSWSLVFEFNETPRMQGYESKAKTYFLVDEAPHNLLKKGFKFDFKDGSHIVGKCEIVSNPININEIQIRIDLIENEKLELKDYIKSINSEDIIYTEEELIKIVKHSNDYPYLFSLVLELNKEIALSYLKKYFLTKPVENNVVYHSNLPFFLYRLDRLLGKSSVFKFIKTLPSEVQKNSIVRRALDELY